MTLSITESKSVSLANFDIKFMSLRPKLTNSLIFTEIQVFVNPRLLRKNQNWNKRRFIYLLFDFCKVSYHRTITLYFNELFDQCGNLAVI